MSLHVQCPGVRMNVLFGRHIEVRFTSEKLILYQPASLLTSPLSFCLCYQSNPKNNRLNIHKALVVAFMRNVREMLLDDKVILGSQQNCIAIFMCLFSISQVFPAELKVSQTPEVRPCIFLARCVSEWLISRRLEMCGILFMSRCCQGPVPEP